ncbi:hypothetical protein Tco_1296007, partial [Tanacetum coccineum]
IPIPDDVHVLDTEDTDVAHLLKIKPIPDWLKPVPEEERPKTPKPDYVIRKLKLRKVDLEGPDYKIDLVNPKGHRVIPDVSKSLPLGGPPGQLKAANYPDFGIEELIPSLWIESKREYVISTAHVRSYMRILSVVSLKTISRYGYTYLKEIVLRRADYNEYKILGSDFKNLYPNDFEDL